MPDQRLLAETRWDVLLHEDEWARHLAEETLVGLQDLPAWTPPVWFYDSVGSALFDRITRLGEYYPTRAERAILREVSPQIASLSQAESLVELGAGSADKTRLLLAALEREGTLRRYVPVDCSHPALLGAADRVREGFPDLPVHGVVADFTTHLSDLPPGPNRMIAFLGSTIGNFPADRRATFLAAVAAELHAGDTFLLGTDLVKDSARLVAAYDDASGVTAEFNLNSLVVMNRHLGANFHPERFRHRAVWREELSRIEMHAVSCCRQEVRFDELGGFRLRLNEGDWIITELSAKFRRRQVRQELAAVGLATVQQWTDDGGDFLLTLAAPAEVRVT